MPRTPPQLIEFFDRLHEGAEEFTEQLNGLDQETTEGWTNGLPKKYLPVLVDQLKMVETDLTKLGLLIGEIRAQLADTSPPESLTEEQKKVVGDQKHMDRVVEMIKPLMFATSFWLQSCDESSLSAFSFSDEIKENEGNVSEFSVNSSSHGERESKESKEHKDNEE